MLDEAIIGQTKERTGQPVRYRVAGMDCPSCATKIETALRRLPGIDDISLNYHSQTLRLTLDETATPRERIEGTLRNLGYGVDAADDVQVVADGRARGDAAMVPAEQPWWTTPKARVTVLNEPVAEMMGLFGAIALVVNVAAAVVLLPHRVGDANVRAVWLFSRNDALGNLAVVVAAGLIGWTGTRWPDLVVAVVIAGLFLQSSWSVITDARTELRTATAGA